jgi:hypothetical protein
MPNLPFFSGINYEPWATEMKKLLWLVDLLHYDHEGCVKFYDKRRGAIALQLIMSTLDENILSSILREFGEVSSAKIFWNILEIKYSMKWSENVEVDEGIVVENGDCVDSLITGTKNENDIIEVAMINEETDTKITFSDLVNSTEIDNGDECEYLVNLVKYDDENFSSECWFQMLHEKKLIDELLSGKVTLLAEQVDETTTRKIVAKEATKDKDESTLDENGLNVATIKVEAVEQKEEHSNEVSIKFEEELLFLEE